MHHRLEQLLFLFYNFQLSFVSLKTQTALRFGILSTDSFFIDKRLRTPPPLFAQPTFIRRSEISLHSDYRSDTVLPFRGFFVSSNLPPYTAKFRPNRPA